MAGQGHQFPGNFQGNAAGMRSGFGGGPMSGQMQSMPNQLAGVMGGPMANTGGMVGMGNQMVPPYGATMQNQMGNMGMGPQGMGVGVSGGPGAGMGPQNVQQTGGMQTVAVSNTTAPPPAQRPPHNHRKTRSLTLHHCANLDKKQCKYCEQNPRCISDIKSYTTAERTHGGENTSNDKKAKMQEQLRTIRLLFKRLRLIYEKCNETCQDEAENKALDERRNTESYRLALKKIENLQNRRGMYPAKEQADDADDGYVQLEEGF
uniref:Mediator of RNA polymerase II transcription subunit 30 n=1 Tax=Heliothis virescens TaxID=7102 RepID=A0A2A4JQA4_HELVI